jgi:hypothetical protein
VWNGSAWVFTSGSNLGRRAAEPAAGKDETMSEETIRRKSCAHPSCACEAEKGREFCSDACRNAAAPTGSCSCGHKGCGTQHAYHSKGAPDR